MQTSFTIRRNVVTAILSLALAPLSLGSTAPPPPRTDGGVRQNEQEEKRHFTDEDLKVEKMGGEGLAPDRG